MFSAHNLNLNRVPKHYIKVKLSMSAPFQNKSAELLLKVAENLDVIILMKEILFLRTTYECHLTPSFLPLQLQVFDNRMTQSRCKV